MKIRKHWSDKLAGMGACRAGKRFCRRYKTPRQAWNACRNTSFMFWFVKKIFGENSEQTRLADMIDYYCPRPYDDEPSERAKCDAIRKLIKFPGLPQ